MSKLEKWWLLAVVITSLIYILCACESNPKDDIITSKNDGSFNAGIVESAANDLLQNNYSINYTNSFSSTDKSVDFEIDVNKEILTSDMPVIEVVPHYLSSADANRVAVALFGETDFYEAEPMLSSNFTKAEIQEKIDNLYSIFEREIASYKVVMRQKKILPDYLKHAKENNKKLQEELERLMLTYIFDETYAADVRSFASDISGVETAVLPTLENFETQVKPFSELEKIFEKSLNTLSAVENGQVEVFENLRAIEKNEAKARDELDVYIDKLHVIKRYMEKRNLPGIPESFLSVFFSTSAQIEALMDELSRGRINIDAVMRLTETSKNAIEHLEKTAYLVVQNATLTEQLLQYSNRYRSFEPAVQSSFEHALKLFEVDHDYDASLEEISYALEKVEPGVTDRFVSSYEKTREQIRM